MEPLKKTVYSLGSDAGADGCIAPHVLLRYLEQLRWDAIHEDYGALRSAFSDGHFAVVAAQKLHLWGPIGVGRALIGTTGIQHVGTTSFQLFHCLSESSGSPLAVALLTLVLRNNAGRSIRVPDLIRQHLAPVELDESWFLPSLSEPSPADAWQRTVEVRPSDLDVLQHVNHSNYLAFYDDTRLLAGFNEGAGPFQEAAAASVAYASLDYRREAVIGDLLTIKMWPLTDLPNNLGFEMWKNGVNEPISKARFALTESG